MKTILKSIMLMVAGLFAATASAELVAQWKFDDPANPLKATVGSDAVVGYGEGSSEIKEGLNNCYVLTAEKDATAFNALEPSDGGALCIPQGDHLRLPIDKSQLANHAWTIRVRFFSPAASEGKFSCFFKRNANTSDGDIFINKNSKIGGGWAYSSTYGTTAVTHDSWHWLEVSQRNSRALVVKLDRSVEIARANGVIDDFFSGCTGDMLLFSADNNSEDALMYVSQIEIYDEPLEDIEPLEVIKDPIPMPAGYTQLDTLYAPRGTYIDTKFAPKGDTCTVMTFDVHSVNEYWFGAWDGSWSSKAYAVCNDNGGVYIGYGNSGGGTKGPVVDNGVHTIGFRNGQFFLDGNFVRAAGTSQAINLTSTLYLFAENQIGTAGQRTGQKTLYFKGGQIYDGQTPVRDFVPCRTDKGEVGLWDRVEGKFYGNAGTGHFACPDDVDVRLSWIQSSGAQYIDTKILGNAGLEAELDVMILNSGNNDSSVLASRNGTSGRFYFLHLGTSNTKGFYGYAGDNKQTWEYETMRRYSVKSILHAGDQQLVVDDVTVKSGTDATDLKTGYNLYFFACNDTGSAKWFSCARLYHAVIKKNGEVMADFVPYRKADGRYGLLDLANGANEFYPNKGTGADFTWGGIAYNIDGTTLKLHEGTLAASDLVGYTAVEKVDWYALDASAVTEFATPLTLTKGSFSLTDGEVKTVTVGGKLAFKGGATLKIDAIGTACDNFAVASLDLTEATEENPFVLEIASAAGMDWSKDVTLVANTGLADGPCANIRIAENDELMPVIKNGNLVICMKSSACHWTGAVDGDLSKPANWEERVLPTAETVVYFAGTAVPSIPVGATFAAKQVEVVGATLAGDRDWRGLDPSIPVNGKIDLQGHNLTVSKLTGTYEITDSDSREIADPSAVVYERLEYIESTGAQYIDTGYTHASNTKVECVADVSSTQPGSWSAIFGARNVSYTKSAFCFFAKRAGNLNTSCYNRTGVETSGSAYPKDAKSSLTCLGKTATWESEDGTSGSFTTTGTDDDGVNAMFVFNLNKADEGGKKADTSGIAMKLYAFRISEDGEVKRDFVPVRRVSDSKIGLLDLANLGTDNEFYVNQGTGVDFTAGAANGVIITKPGSTTQHQVPGGELHVVTDTVIENTTVTLSGALRLVKEGAGAFTAAKAGTFTGGMEVKGGALVVPTGIVNCEIEVGAGATLELNGNATMNVHPLVLAGGTVLNSSGTATIGAVTLTDNSAVSVASAIKATGLIDLGGNTLTETTGDGAMFTLADGACIVNGEVVVNGALNVAADVAVDDWTVTYAGSDVSGSGCVYIGGMYTPTTDYQRNFVLSDGAALNLAEKNEPWTIGALQFADNATLTINVGERTMKVNEQVVAWTQKPANIDGLNFKFVGAKLGDKPVQAVFMDDGLYCPDVAAIVKATWTGAAHDGNVANAENWTCENALGNVVTGDDALPGASTAVYLDGEIALNIPNDASFAAGSVRANASLAEDCDWSGFDATILVSGKIDLKGRKLTVSQFPATWTAEITDSSATGYEQLDYIESTGSQYIDTEYTHASNTKVECVVDVSSAQPNGWSAVFGARNVSYTKSAFCFFAKCASDLSKSCYNRSGNENRGDTYPKDAKSTLTCVGTTASWESEGGASGSNTTTGKADDGVNAMFVFNLNKAGEGAKKADTSGIAMKLYAFKISEDGVVKRNFVPARRVSDGAIGLLDLAHLGSTDSANPEFYENKGTGTFTSGATTGYIFTKPGSAEQVAPGELHVNVAGSVVTNATVTITGTLKFVKEGDGAFMATKTGQSYLGGTEVKDGTLMMPMAVMANNGYVWDSQAANHATSQYLGAQGSEIAVDSGAVFNTSGNFKLNCYHIILNGGEMLNALSDGGNAMQADVPKVGGIGWLSLIKDSTDKLCSYTLFSGRDDTPVDLGGNTLTIDGCVDARHIYWRKDIKNGTLYLKGYANKKVDFNVTAAVDAKSVTLIDEMGLKITAAMDVGNYISRLAWNNTYCGGTAALNVYGVFRPETSYFYGCTLQDGATLDLSMQKREWSVTSALTSTGSKTVAFADGATITVLTDRKVGGKLVSWSAAPENVNFVREKTVVGRLEVKPDGLYLRTGLVITFR